jgi:serine/threonine protein kinase
VTSDREEYLELKKLFLAARDLEAADRAEYLDRACPDDASLRGKVEGLLALHDQGEESLEMDAMTTRSLPAPREATPHAPTIEGYEIEGVLGHGGMGIVYRAVQNKLNRSVALKVLPAVVGSANPSMVARFRREATAAARLHHTNIVPIYDFGESHNSYYYAMEMITGQPLSVFIRRLADHDAAGASAARLADLLRLVSKAERDFSTDSEAREVPDASGSAAGSSGSRSRIYYRQVAQWIADAAEALHYAHGEGIIHRDVKPANLIVSTEGRIMLTDFGIAKNTAEQSLTVTGSLVGTLRYTSPEQAMAKRVAVDHRTDIYSLGATMYELLCFQPAFLGDDEKEILGAIIAEDPTPPRRIAPTVPSELETICLKTLEKSPGARYSTARAMAEDVRRYLHDLPIVAKRPGPIRRSIKFAKRHKVGVTIVAAAILVTGASLYAALFQRAARESEAQALVEVGIRLVEQKNWAEAESKLQEANRVSPNHPRPLSALAWMKMKRFYDSRGHADVHGLEEAEDLCRRALEEDPEHFDALNLRAVILRMLNRNSEAIPLYRRIIELQPGYFPAWSNLGASYAVAGDLTKAEEHLEKGAALAGEGEGQDSYRASAWRNLAALELQLKKSEAAVHLETAQRWLQNDPINWLLRARMHLDLEGSIDTKLALRAAEHADLLAGGNDERVKRIPALCHLRNAEPAQAIGHAQRALELGDPLRATDHLVIAVAEASRGRIDVARAAYQQALDSWPPEFRNAGDVTATIHRAVLWFDSADELFRLRDEAQQIIAGATP